VSGSAGCCHIFWNFCDENSINHRLCFPSVWVTQSHSAVHYSSPLGITNLHYSPYQSLTNHPTNHAYYVAYQFLTHAPMLPMHYIITYAHFSLIYSSQAFPPFLLTPCNDFPLFLSLLFNLRTLPNHCGRLKRSQYYPQSYIFPIRSPSVVGCNISSFHGVCSVEQT